MTSLETFAREAWRASCAVNGRPAGGPIRLDTAFSCLRTFAKPDCEYRSLHQMAVSGLTAAANRNSYLFEAYNSDLPSDCEIIR